MHNALLLLPSPNLQLIPPHTQGLSLWQLDKFSSSFAPVNHSHNNPVSLEQSPMILEWPARIILTLGNGHGLFSCTLAEKNFPSLFQCPPPFQCGIVCACLHNKCVFYTSLWGVVVLWELRGVGEGVYRQEKTLRVRDIRREACRQFLKRVWKITTTRDR